MEGFGETIATTVEESNRGSRDSTEKRTRVLIKKKKKKRTMEHQEIILSGSYNVERNKSCTEQEVTSCKNYIDKL